MLKSLFLVAIILLFPATTAPEAVQNYPSWYQYSGGRISNADSSGRWYGSCRISAYWTTPDGRAGALAWTNYHVAPGETGNMSAEFVLPDGRRKSYPSEYLLGAYSTRRAIDVALIFVEGLNEGTGIKPIPALQTGPPDETTKYQYTGCPQGRFPPVSYEITLKNVISNNVYRYEPISQPGTSGGCAVDNHKTNGEYDPRACIVNAWQWGNYGAGMSTETVYNVIDRSFREGWDAGQLEAPERPTEDGGLIELFAGPQEAAPKEGFHVSEVMARALGPAGAEPVAQAASFRDFPVWWKESDPEPDPPPSPSGLTDEEIAAAEDLKGQGFDLISVFSFHRSLMRYDKTNEPEPDPEPTEAKPEEKAKIDLSGPEPAYPNGWTPPPYNAENGTSWYENTVHNGRRLTRVCDINGECIYQWLKIE